MPVSPWQQRNSRPDHPDRPRDRPSRRGGRLAWLGLHHGGVARLNSWAHDDPIWRIAEREGCSVRTVDNRIDRSIAAILKEFGGVDMAFVEIDERPDRAHPPSFISQRPIAGDSSVVSQHGKVWIDGVGFMLKGRRLRDGRHRTTTRTLYAD